MTKIESIDSPENWDEASSGYASKVAPLLMEDFAEELCNMISANENDKVLEIAAGSGALTRTLSKKVKSLLATDFSKKMLDLNQKSLNELGISNTRFEVMDGQDLKVFDESFDKVACMFGLMLFPNRNKGLSEILRALRPNGVAVISGWAAPDRFELYGLFSAAIEKSFPNIERPKSPPPVLSLSNLDIFKDEMISAGFKNVKTQYVTRKLVIDTFEDYWSALTVGAPPVKMLMDKIGENNIEVLKSTLQGMVHDIFGQGKIIFNNSATVGVGYK